MIFTAGQIVAHLVGDYALQSDWMAAKKTERSWQGRGAAFVHAVLYTLPFVLITRNWRALVFILVTHFVIDHWRLARHVGWLKNWLAPRWLRTVKAVGENGAEADIEITVQPGVSIGRPGSLATVETADGKKFTVWELYVRNLPWRKCSKTGYPDDKPAWMAVWLLIITDNTMHLLLNGVALYLWGNRMA